MSPEEAPPDQQSPPTDGIPAKRARAKHACRECNARRVRCNVTEAHPCANCEASGAKCEVLPSRRGRYPRRSRRQSHPVQAKTAALLSVAIGDDGIGLSSIDSTHSALTVRGDSTTNSLISTNVPDARLPARTPSPSTGLAAPGTLFFGESNFLTLVSGRPRQGEEPSQNGHVNGSKQKARLLFPITSTPQSIPEGESPASCDRVSSGTARYLSDEGALTLPDLHTCVPALQAYFTWFHPCFPVLDRAEFTRRLASFDVSYLLLQSMLFIGATYCENDTIVSMGFKDRSEAKSLLYTGASLLFHADWEKDEITLIQSLFLISFWRSSPSDVRDVRLARCRNRSGRVVRTTQIVRERQAVASLGLPSRIRDDDCNIEPFSPSDLESEIEKEGDSHFGSFRELEHILGAWKQSLPDELGRGLEDGNASVWWQLLHLAYNHVRILIHRHSLLKQVKEGNNGQIAVAAASCISRIAEDMLAQGTLRYGQMHLITSLSAALCIHAISIKRGVDVTRRIAEHRAQMCLLALREIQNLEPQETADSQGEAAEGGEQYEFPTPQTQAQTKAFGDQYFNMFYGPWEGDDGVADLGLVLQADDPLQMESLNFLGRSL
ncbi:hypothetical protein QQZ08_001221 [Neonectria magnoliae]|uniref:Zn(2)-C6 fungal-type domain-containing protein n=1 Tax=Neonectria magnoliae TaxID=2732573 RepID=A0ABR1IGI4_9HYPO